MGAVLSRDRQEECAHPAGPLLDVWLVRLWEKEEVESLT